MGPWIAGGARQGALAQGQGGWALPILMAGVRGPGGVIWELRGSEAVPWGMASTVKGGDGRAIINHHFKWLIKC
jgi:hypothetical protein